MRFFIALFLLLGCGTFLAGQQQQQPQQQQQQQQQAQPQAPGGLSRTDPLAPENSEAPASLEPTIEPQSDETPPVAEYTGPAILSRGFSTARPMVPREVKFRPFLGVSGIYDSGLTGLVLTKSGQVESSHSFGIEADFGIDGRKLWKKDMIGLEYRGNFYHYTPASFYDGTNHFLSLDYKHQASKHLSLNFTEAAGMYGNNYALLNATGASDISIANTEFAVLPNTQAFDNRTIFLTSQVDAVYQESARLSINLGGGAFLVRRRSTALYGSAGEQARADISYRFSRKTTVGPYYAFTHYGFTKGFGGSDVHTTGVNISHAFSRAFELRFRAGVSRIETSGLISAPLDPVVAAVLGQTVGIQFFHRINQIPDASAQLTKTVRHTTASLEYSRGVTPGNGFYLTSQREAVDGNIEYTGIRRYAFSAGAGRDSLSSLGATLGVYNSYYARAGVVRNLNRNIRVTLHTEFRKFDINTSNFTRDQFRVTLGFSYSPEDRPLTVW